MQQSIDVWYQLYLPSVPYQSNSPRWQTPFESNELFLTLERIRDHILLRYMDALSRIEFPYFGRNYIQRREESFCNYFDAQNVATPDRTPPPYSPEEPMIQRWFLNWASSLSNFKNWFSSSIRQRLLLFFLLPRRSVGVCVCCSQGDRWLWVADVRQQFWTELSGGRDVLLGARRLLSVCLRSFCWVQHERRPQRPEDERLHRVLGSRGSLVRRRRRTQTPPATPSPP